MDEIKKNKIRLGILGCGFACHNGLTERLNPWFDRIEAKTDFVFSFVSAKFKEYEDLNIKQDNSETIKAFKFLLDNKLINYLSIPDKAMSESEARNLALKPLLEAGCDYILLLDLSDEYYNAEQIHNILYFLNQEDNQFYDWFSIPFKNYFQTKTQWIDGFCPPRLFKTYNSNGLKLDSFFWDNDIFYKTSTGGMIDYRQLPNKSIPKNLLCNGIKHFSWLSNENSFNKIKYHESHFKQGFGCSYKWADGEVVFNEEYYSKIGQPLPIIMKDE